MLFLFVQKHKPFSAYMGIFSHLIKFVLHYLCQTIMHSTELVVEEYHVIKSRKK